MNLKDVVKKLIYPHSYSSDAYIEYLRGGG